MNQSLRQRCSAAFVVLVTCVLAACSSKPRGPAPVEDRMHGSVPRSQPAVVASGTSTPVAPSGTVDPRTLPGAENAGRPGYYTVRPGDTLIRIALDSGQNWRDVARWNNLENPNIIEVGQVLRVVQPGVGTAAVAAPPAAAASAADPSGVTTRAVPPSDVASAPVPAASGARPASSAASAPASTAVAIAPPSAGSTPANSPPVPAADEQITWSWPAPGNTTVVAPFDDARNKGVDISGRAGDPVLASADGRVVYAGAGLRGYGNLIILKHNNTYLTAYAHNQTLLVKEDQVVRKGQKIAEMGATDTDRVKLHFEIRRQGRPVDPARYLQAR